MALVSTNSFYLQTLQTHILRFSSLYGHMSTTTDKTLKINHLNMFLLSINPHGLRNILISPVPRHFFGWSKEVPRNWWDHYSNGLKCHAGITFWQIINLIWWCSWMNLPINGKTYICLNVDIPIPCYRIQLEKLNFMLMKLCALILIIVHIFSSVLKAIRQTIDVIRLKSFSQLYSVLCKINCIGVSGGLNC